MGAAQTLNVQVMRLAWMANAKILAGSHMDHVGAMQSVKPLHTDLFVSAQLGGPEIPTLNASPVSEI